MASTDQGVRSTASSTGHAPAATRTAAAGLALGALGVIFGDIGTSPLYAFQVALSPAVGMRPVRDEVLGVLSMFIWSLIIVVTVKYVFVVMRADNKGEGGVLALQALADRAIAGRRRAFVAAAALVALCLFCADAVLTPSISVLSSVEGLEVTWPGASRIVVPAALVILTVLFVIQRWGTQGIGRLFGPVMVVWFGVLGLLGAISVARTPEVLLAVDPLYGARFMFDHPALAFAVMSAVTLAFTGCETLYADMGHFGRRPIAGAWLFVVFPGVVLSYLGQGALVLRDPAMSANPFFNLAPAALTIPLVALATVATVIASQAVISGAYSVTRQAIQLGMLPRMQVLQTSKTIRGQITVPVITALLYVAVVLTVIGFGSSARLSAAYGLAVVGTMAITTVLTLVIARGTWRWSWLRSALVLLPLIVVDLAFLSANVVKIAHGAWFSLGLGVVILIVMLAWQDGRRSMLKVLAREAVDAREFAERVVRDGGARVPGSAIYLVASPSRVPRALVRAYGRHGGLHAATAILTVQTVDTPLVEDEQRVELELLAPAFWRVLVRYGFAESPDVPATIAACGIPAPFALDEAVYVVGHDVVTVASGGVRGLGRRVFGFLHRRAQISTDFFGIPPERTVTLGALVEI